MGVVWPGDGEGLLWLDLRASMTVEKVNKAFGWIARVVKIVSLLITHLMLAPARWEKNLCVIE